MFGMIDGNKTYLVAAFIVFVGVVEGMLGVDLPGIAIEGDWLQYIVVGLGLGSIRSAINKIIGGFTGN